jgi:hypothetical protein
MTNTNENTTPFDLKIATDDELLSLQTLVDVELRSREETWRKRLAKLQLARGTRTTPAVRTRGIRSDKGKPRAMRTIEGKMENAFVSTDPGFQAPPVAETASDFGEGEK